MADRAHSRSKASPSASAACRPCDDAVADGRRRRHHRADRPERRRQDHAVRAHRRLPDAERRARSVYDGDDITGVAAAPAGAARHRAHLPDRAAVRRSDGARKHRGRRASAPSRRAPRALAAADEVAKRVGLGTCLRQPAATLTVAGRKRLELARALATEPKLLLLDEVLAGLNPSEIRDMVPVIRAIRDRGVTILMIEHVMQAVMSLAEHVYVLAEGRIIAQGPPAAVVGRSQGDRGLSRRTAPRPGSREAPMAAKPLLDVRGLHAGYGEVEILRGIDLARRRRARSSRCSAPTAPASRRSTMTISGVCCRAPAVDPLRRRARSSATPAGRDRRARPDPRAGGPPHLPEPDGARESRSRQLSPRRRAPRATTASACSRFSRACASARRSAPARCRAASSRCWRSAAA